MAIVCLNAVTFLILNICLGFENPYEQFAKIFPSFEQVTETNQPTHYIRNLSRLKSPTKSSLATNVTWKASQWDKVFHQDIYGAANYEVFF